MPHIDVHLADQDAINQQAADAAPLAINEFAEALKDKYRLLPGTKVRLSETLVHLASVSQTSTNVVTRCITLCECEIDFHEMPLVHRMEVFCVAYGLWVRVRSGGEAQALLRQYTDDMRGFRKLEPGCSWQELIKLLHEKHIKLTKAIAALGLQERHLALTAMQRNFFGCAAAWLGEDRVNSDETPSRIVVHTKERSYDIFYDFKGVIPVLKAMEIGCSVHRLNEILKMYGVRVLVQTCIKYIETPRGVRQLAFEIRQAMGTMWGKQPSRTES